MFSLRALLVAVAYSAVAVAALINQTPFWQRAIISLTVGLAIAATIAAWFLPTARTFYGPFAFVVWLYLLILFFAPLHELERNLITTDITFDVWRTVIDEPKYSAERWESNFEERPTLMDSSVTSHKNLIALAAFYHSVHCVVATLLGALAGFLTMLAIRRRAKVVSEKKE